MNEIVRKIVSVADLPEHLRAGLDPTRPVEIVQVVPDDHRSGLPGLEDQEARRRYAADWLERVRAARGDRASPFRSMDDIVDYVRAVRDGGDLSKWLGDPPISTPTR
jgi:hypothetical protein